MGHYSPTRPADRRSPGLEPLLAGMETKVCPERERAVSSALERGLMTVVILAFLLSGGFIFVWEVLAKVHRIASALRVGH